MSKRVPQIKNIGNVTYIETDFIIVNALPEVQKIFGGFPVTWNVLSGTTVLSDKYIIRHFGGSGPHNIVRPLNENTNDFCCGQLDEKNKSIFAKPKLRKRNEINEFGGFSSLKVGDREFFNPSKEEIVNYFKRYLADTGNQGKKLFYYDTDNNDRLTQLTTWDDVYEKYPEYFFHEYETNRQAVASIAGTVSTKGFYADGSYTATKNVGLWESFKTRGLNDQAIKKELLDSGYTISQINSFLNQRSVYVQTPGSGNDSDGTKSSGSGSGYGDGGGRNPGNSDSGLPTLQSGSLTTIEISRNRNLFGGQVDVGNAFIIKNNSEKDKYLLAPQIFQLVPQINQKWGYLEYIPNRYLFIHKPNEIQYSGLGSEWVSVDRNGGFAFVDWKKFQLLQISFSFVIAQDTDGLLKHVEDEIELLRKIAQTPYPVSFFNFDSMFSQEFRYDANQSNNIPVGIQFVITDFSITAQQRDTSMRITRAQASMTLQEIPIEKQKLIAMPRLVPKGKKTPPTPDDPSGQSVLPSGVLGAGFVDKDFNYNPADIG